MENAEDNSGDFQGTLINVLQSSLEAKTSDSDETEAVYRAKNKRQDSFEENHGDFEEYGDKCCSAFDSMKQNIEDLKTITAASGSDSGESLLAMQGSDTSFLENYLMGRVENNLGRDLILKSERNNRFANVFGKSDFSDYFTCSYLDAETSILNIQHLMEEQVDKYQLQLMEESKEIARVSTEYKEVESDGDETPPEAQNLDSLNDLLLYHRKESSGFNNNNQQLSPNENESDSEIDSYESDRTSLNEFLPDLIQSEFLSNERNCKNTFDDTRNERHHALLKPFASSIISTTETQNLSENEYIFQNDVDFSDLIPVLKMKGNSDKNESEESNFDKVQLEFVDAERNNSILQPLQDNNDSTQVIDPDIQSLISSETPCSCEHYTIENGINERDIEGDQFPTNENIGKHENELFKSKSIWKMPGISNADESVNSNVMSLAANLHSSFENDQTEIGINERDTVDNHFLKDGVNETENCEPIWITLGSNSNDFSDSNFPIYQLESGNEEESSSQEQQCHIQKDYKLSYIPSKLNNSDVTHSYENNAVDILQNEFSITTKYYNTKDEPEFCKSTPTLNEIVENDFSVISANNDIGKEEREVYKSTLNEIVEDEVSITSADEVIGIEEPEFYESILNEMVENEVTIISADEEIGIEEPEFYESISNEMVENDFSITSTENEIGKDEPEFFKLTSNEIVENESSISAADKEIGNDEQEIYKSIRTSLKEIVENEFSITSADEKIGENEQEFYKSIPHVMVVNDFSINCENKKIEKDEQGFYESIPNNIVENKVSITLADGKIVIEEPELYQSIPNKRVKNDFLITSADEIENDKPEFCKITSDEIVENEFSITVADDKIKKVEQEFYKSAHNENEIAITSADEKNGKEETEFYKSTLISLNEIVENKFSITSEDEEIGKDEQEVYKSIRTSLKEIVENEFSIISADEKSGKDEQEFYKSTLISLNEMGDSNLPSVPDEFANEANEFRQLQQCHSDAHEDFKLPDIESDISPEVESEISPEIKSDISPEVESEISPEIKSEISPCIKSDISPEVESDISPEIKSDISPDIKSDTSPEIQSDISLEILPDISPKIQSIILHGIQSDNSPGIQLNISPGIQSDISEIESDISLEIQSDISPEIQSDILLEIQSDISPEIQSDISLEIQSGISLKILADISPEIQCDYENNQDVQFLINEKCWNEETKDEITPWTMSECSNEDHLGESIQSQSFACECVDIDINDSLLIHPNATKVDFSFPDIQICTSEIESNCQSDETMCIVERDADHFSVERDIDTNEAEFGEIASSLIIPEPDNSSKNNFSESNFSDVEIKETLPQNKNDTQVVNFALPNIQPNFISGSTGDSEINKIEIIVVEKDADNENIQSKIRKRKHRHENSSSTTTVNSMVEITKKVKMIDSDCSENRSTMGDSDLKQYWELFVRNDCWESEVNNTIEEEQETNTALEIEKIEIATEPETTPAEVQPANFAMGLCLRVKTFFTSIPNLFRKRRHRRVDPSSEKQ